VDLSFASLFDLGDSVVCDQKRREIFAGCFWCRLYGLQRKSAKMDLNGGE